MMKSVLMMVVFYSTLCSMDNDYRIKQFREKAKNDLDLLKELKAPVFIDHQGNEYYLSGNKRDDVCSEQLDVSFYRYKNMLERKMRLEEIEQLKKKQRIETLYLRVSVLCIVLGHISGVW